MSIFKPGKTCVFSSVSAVITQSGQPLKNVKVVRKWEWNKLNQDSTTTNENGYFEFPAVFEFSIARFLPIELVIGQGLYVVIDGEEKKIWSNSKREPEENAEYGGKNFNASCDLDAEERLVKDYGSLMVTKCFLKEH